MSPADADPDHSSRHPALFALTLGAIGVVFGDIGTSPLYAFREALGPASGDGIDAGEILGVLSLMLWTLTLIVTDLHLEKASWYARSGQMLPPYDTLATLADLTALRAATDAAEVWCLGDSFHDVEGCARLPAEARAALTALTAATHWTWITGNHDPVVADHCGGTVADEAVVDGVVLRHEADPGEPRPELSGHFHPKLRVRVRGRLVQRRCFVASDTKLVLPAFGALTGGLDPDHPEIVRAVGARAEALVPVADRLLRFTAFA